MVGLGDEIVRAEIHAHELIELAVPAGDDDDGHIRLLSKLPADVIAVKVREIDVQRTRWGECARMIGARCS